MSKTTAGGSYFHSFTKNGIDYDIYADNSAGYKIFTDVTKDSSGYDEGILVLETRLGPGFGSYSKEQNVNILRNLSQTVIMPPVHA